MSQLEKEVRILKIYAVVSTIVGGILFASLFRMMNAPKFREIDVERMNIVEADGKLRLVISNKARQHPGVMDGVTYEERRGHRPPGLMFFNEKGDELGGLVFDGNTGSGQGGSFTFDKFRGDQTLQLIHEEKTDGTYFAGLKMNDQPMALNDLIRKQQEIEKLPTKEEQAAAYQMLRDQGLLMTERVRIGKDYDQSSLLRMKDARGRVRLELKVEAAGAASLNLFDETGKIVDRWPPTSR